VPGLPKAGQPLAPKNGHARNLSPKSFQANGLKGSSNNSTMSNFANSKPNHYFMPDSINPSSQILSKGGQGSSTNVYNLSGGQDEPIGYSKDITLGGPSTATRSHQSRSYKRRYSSSNIFQSNWRGNIQSQ
jgi:hypothetical protein